MFGVQGECDTRIEIFKYKKLITKHTQTQLVQPSSFTSIVICNYDKMKWGVGVSCSKAPHNLTISNQIAKVLQDQE